MAMTYDPTTADVGTVEKIAAGDLIIDPNVRTNIRLDKSFVSSIRVYGFEQYPVGYQEDGKTHITIGQRRVSAALEIGWPVIPVVVKAKLQAEADRVDELRILTQLAENEHRTPLGGDESARAYKQLQLFGVSEDQIARKTNSPKGRIQTALKVAGSDTALAAIEDHEIALDHAAVLVEFEDDKKALDELREIARTRPDNFDHAAHRLRNQVARNRAAQSIADKARADGWTVIFKDPNSYEYSYPSGHQRVAGLWRADDPEQKRLTLDDVAGQPGRVVWINAQGHGDEPQVEWLIKDHKKYGYASYSDSTGGGKGPLTEEEKAARKQKRIDRAEMVDATAVRRSWIRDVLLNPLRKKHPDDAITWITGSLWLAATHPRDNYSDAIRFTAEHLLGTPFERSSGSSVPKNPDTGTWFRTTAEGDVHKLLEGVTDPMRYALAIAIGRVEELAGNPKAAEFGQDLRLAEYFRRLRDWGYALADVEQRIVDAADKNRKKGRS